MNKCILAIETSCDETAIAIMRNNELLANVVSSQIKDHEFHGGVIPELASRLHLDNIDIVFQKALKEANISISDISLIAIVNGPGLIGALHVGVVFAKALAYINNIPLLPVHHIAGHIYASNLLEEFNFPLLALVVSGGHTELVLLNEHLDFKILGQTLDDAIGESYDKIARVLGLGYPGGPIIDKLAALGKNNYDFPIPLMDDSYNFSYSGLKSAVINKVNQLKMKHESYENADIACSFQISAITPLIQKTLKAIKEYQINHFVLAGGVAANSYLRKEITTAINKENPNVKVTLPPLWCCTDNAAMICSLASFYNEDSYLNNYHFSVNPNMKLDK
ncbi:tRNA (adenosine(37)-N6)-threonylcarbamoyltransferase complex transferase subunit TsaD [Erysipelotrichaceae bacterium OttesenSCG-928-M19]|nr:tRNA (adenosine(37)-N6)-threonylcarbamoyltransferase complex transferase subunit TsaD [Erysipelotrichaceae bacterium OttesenSCG-928-M19]